MTVHVLYSNGLLVAAESEKALRKCVVELIESCEIEHNTTIKVAVSNCDEWGCMCEREILTGKLADILVRAFSDLEWEDWVAWTYACKDGVEEFVVSGVKVVLPKWMVPPSLWGNATFKRVRRICEKFGDPSQNDLSRTAVSVWLNIPQDAIVGYS